MLQNEYTDIYLVLCTAYATLPQHLKTGKTPTMPTKETGPRLGNAFATQEIWNGYPDPIKAAALGQPRPDWCDCLHKLQPELDAIIRRVKTSPLLIGEKDELALAVAAYFFSAAAAINRKSVPHNTAQ